MRADEHAGDFFRLEVSPPDFAAAKRRAVAAGEGASVGLHDAHETRHPLARVAHLRDTDRIPRAREGASRVYGCSSRPVAVRRLREKRHPCPEIHVWLYTIHETSSPAGFPQASRSPPPLRISSAFTGIWIPSARKRRRMRLRSSCWTRNWSVNDFTWQVSEKSRETSPKPGMSRTDGAGSPKRPGTSPTARVASSTTSCSTRSGSAP